MHRRVILSILIIIVSVSVFLFAVGCKEEAAQDEIAEKTVKEESKEEATEEATTDVAGESEQKTIGIFFPTKVQPVWVSFEKTLVPLLNEKGFETILEYSEDMVDRQLLQVENALTRGIDYLVIAPADSYAVTEVVEKAKDEGVTVIAFDRLIMNTDQVDYYITYDVNRMGQLQGQYIEKALNLDEVGSGSFNIEIFSGSPDDSNGYNTYVGAMSVIQPYIDSGDLVAPSGQTSFDDTAIMKWDGATAQARMDDLIGAHYTDIKLDAVLSAADCLSQGIVASLESFGYGNFEDLPFPIVTGQDCDLVSLKSILEGKQTMSVLLDAEKMSSKFIEMVMAIENGEEVVTNTSFNNDVIDVPTVTYDPKVIDIDNIQTLIDIGFVTEEELEI